MDQEPDQLTADTPADDAAPARADLSPQAVLELIRAGKEVSNAKVRKLKLRGPFDQPVRFRNCTLVQTDVEGATFQQEVTFAACTLDRFAVTRGTTFEKGFSLAHSTLCKATVSRVTVKGVFDAAFADFRGKLTLADNTFEQKATFWEAKFHCWVDVKGCAFKGDADFRSVHAAQGFVLTKSAFHADFLFRGSNVAKKFSADGSRFERVLDLSKAKFPDFCYLEGIEAGPQMRFAFQNVVAERILVQPEQVEGRLQSEETGDYAGAMHEYGILKKCYQSLHRYEYEDRAFYRFKVNQRRAKNATWVRPWTKVRRFADWLFLDVGCGYGTHPGRAVRMAAVIILGFATLYAVNVEMFHAEKRPFPASEVTSPENRIMIGLITSVSVFTSGMGGIREIAQGWMNVPVMIESLMGTLLFGLFIVAFSRKVIR